MRQRRDRTPAPQTVAAAVEASRRELVGVSPTPALDARVLACHALGMDASALIAYGDNCVDDARLRRLSSLVARRRAGEPVAYITGSKEFRHLRLAVDRRVLVPRPETELIVERIVADRHGTTIDVLELGTGSGAIACALADELPEARIVATDVSADALAVAARNVEDHAFGDAITLLQGDLFDPVPPGQRFDVIAANLPYVAVAGKYSADAAVRAFEPPLSIDGGHDGLAQYRRMLPRAGAFLKPSGAVYMECAPDNAAELARLAEADLTGAVVEVIRDLAGLDRLVIAKTRA
jgi:release factor glutamine methyltransferase